MTKSEKVTPRKELLVGGSEYMDSIRTKIKKIANTNMPILIQGETGTGKELIARSIHQEGNRSKKPFVPLNCAAIPETLFESELFGHMKGAFTGATQDREGKVTAANKGTLFLDEIGDLSIKHQAKLLRFLESGEYTRAGGNKVEHSGARIVAATNKTLKSEIEKGDFREDFYQRIAGYVIKTRPLSSSRADVVLLTNHFLGRGKNTLEKARIKSLLYSYDFPGNARQLKKIVEVAAMGYQEVWKRILDIHSDELKELNRTSRLSKDAEQREKEEVSQRLNREDRRFKRFLNALLWTDRTDPIEVKNAVLAYEIITLFQETRLNQRQIANTLQIQQKRLSPSDFQSKFGFALPDRGKRSYPVTHPMNTDSRYCGKMAIRRPPPE
jgi:DNA-binding NtrC family response regulator